MYKSFIKRVIDLLLAIIGFPFFIIVFIIFAPIIKLTDKGSVFYTAMRIGKDGKLFKMYKFRSMYVNAPARGISFTGTPAAPPFPVILLNASRTSERVSATVPSIPVSLKARTISRLPIT